MEQQALLTRIRERLAAREVRRLDEVTGTRAAVLMPLYFVNDVGHLLFNVRTQTVEHHKGQVAFPGGGREPGDADLWATAVRECEEELGLAPGDVRRLGRLDDFWTVSRYVVSPFLGVIPHPYAFTPCPEEVDDVFGVSLETLMDPAVYSDQEATYEGEAYTVPFFEIGEHTIWGATGRLVCQFLQVFLDWSPPQP